MKFEARDSGALLCILGIALAGVVGGVLHAGEPQPRSPVRDGLFLDLDANVGVETEDASRVRAWRNQVAGNAADVFVKQDEGRKRAGSGRPTLKKDVDENRYYLIMGRMGAGLEVVDLELFVNSATPVDRMPVPVNPKANPSKMAIGQERDATNHPGKESFHGEIARFLIYERPLSDAELQEMIRYLVGRYEINLRD